MREIGQAPLLTMDEEAELLRRLRLGDNAAREQLIHAHLRLVVKLARAFEGWTCRTRASDEPIAIAQHRLAVRADIQEQSHMIRVIKSR